MRRINAQLHESLLDLMSVVNSPKSDQKLLRTAGIQLDRGLYPLLVRIARGPIGVTELADQVGRDQSTVSRQIQALERLGLVERRGRDADQRVRSAAITPEGLAAVKKISLARNKLTSEALSGWSTADRIKLSELLRKLADSVGASMLR